MKSEFIPVIRPKNIPIVTDPGPKQTLNFIKDIRQKIENNENVDVDEMVEKNKMEENGNSESSSLTPIVAAKLSVGISGLGFIRKQREQRELDLKREQTLKKLKQFNYINRAPQKAR